MATLIIINEHDDVNDDDDDDDDDDDHLLLSLSAVVSAISAFLTLGTHCSYISHFNTCLMLIVLFAFPNKLMMMMMMMMIGRSCV